MTSHNPAQVSVEEQKKVEEEQSDPTVDKIYIHNLTYDQQFAVRSMLINYWHMCQLQLGKVRNAKHHIEWERGACLVLSQPYIALPQSLQIIQSNIYDMNIKMLTEPIKSEWAFSVVLASKEDRSIRFFVDYHHLSALTGKDSFPILRMYKFLDSLGTATLFSTIDWNLGYWKIPVAQGDIMNTAITSHADPISKNELPLSYATPRRHSSKLLTFC